MSHGTDICLDCHFEKQCGDKAQNAECNFLKKLEMVNLVRKETIKIQGKALSLNGHSWVTDENYSFLKLTDVTPYVSILSSKLWFRWKLYGVMLTTSIDTNLS